MEENFATRLKLFMDSTGIPSSQFADLCEIPRPSFSQLLSGRNQKVSDVIIKKLHTAFPDLSVMWLLFGEGDMTKSKNSENGGENSGHIETGQKNPSEISEIPNNGSENSDRSNLRGLTNTGNGDNSSVIQQFEENKKILELQMQIDNLQKNPRKVTQITVYYDDCTFETFIPSK